MEFSPSLSLPPCSICPRTWKTPRLNGPVPASGPTPSPLCFIGEAPAKNEDRTKLPFSGSTGKEFDQQYLPSAGLTRDQVYVTNTMKCSLPRYANPKPDLACQCAERHLPLELRTCSPEILIPMGVVACSVFDSPIDLELHYGFPQANTLYGTRYLVVPMYHPASGLHETRQMTFIQEQFRMLGDILAGSLSAPSDPYPTPIYRLLDDPRDVTGVLGLGDPFDVAIDTEHDLGRTWCLSFSNLDGSGYVIRKTAPEALAAFWSWISSHSPQIWFHYALHDIPHCLNLGADPELHFGLSSHGLHRGRDTMVECFHYGTYQALKTNAYRRLGMRMRNWEDVCRPHAEPLALDYLQRLSLIPDLPQPYLKPRQWTLARKAKQAVKQFLDKGPAEVDLFKRFTEWGAADAEAAERILGPFPWPSIAHVPLSESVPYAGADADGTFRLRRHVRRLNTGIRREIRYFGD